MCKHEQTKDNYPKQHSGQDEHELPKNQKKYSQDNVVIGSYILLFTFVFTILFVFTLYKVCQLRSDVTNVDASQESNPSSTTNSAENLPCETERLLETLEENCETSLTVHHSESATDKLCSENSTASNIPSTNEVSNEASSSEAIPMNLLNSHKSRKRDKNAIIEQGDEVSFLRTDGGSFGGFNPNLEPINISPQSTYQRPGYGQNPSGVDNPPSFNIPINPDLQTSPIEYLAQGNDNISQNEPPSCMTGPGPIQNASGKEFPTEPFSTLNNVNTDHTKKPRTFASDHVDIPPGEPAHSRVVSSYALNRKPFQPLHQSATCENAFGHSLKSNMNTFHDQKQHPSHFGNQPISSHNIPVPSDGYISPDNDSRDSRVHHNDDISYYPTGPGAIQNVSSFPINQSNDDYTPPRPGNPPSHSGLSNPVLDIGLHPRVTQGYENSDNTYHNKLSSCPTGPGPIQSSPACSAPSDKGYSHPNIEMDSHMNTSKPRSPKHSDPPPPYNHDNSTLLPQSKKTYPQSQSMHSSSKHPSSSLKDAHTNNGENASCFVSQAIKTAEDGEKSIKCRQKRKKLSSNITSSKFSSTDSGHPEQDDHDNARAIPGSVSEDRVGGTIFNNCNINIHKATGVQLGNNMYETDV
ncbi:uncharacterized protein [Amphiura filiformis]|uniref:uncharacterized protein n=1 Tax=Amphiura filiformis TaxID=82378 RepID=UPI003B218C7B